MASAKIDTKEAVKEINNLIEQFNLLIKATGDVSSVSKGNFRKVETALAALKTVSTQANASFEKMTAAQKALVLENQRLAAALEKSKSSTRSLNAETRELLRTTNAAAVSQNQLGQSANKTKGFFKSLFGSASDLISAFGVLKGVQLFAAILKDAYDLTKKFNSLQFALERIVQDTFDVSASQRFLLDLTASFGVELVTTTERWIKFLAAAKQAGVTLLDTEQIFKSVTKAASVLGLGTDDLNSIYLALEQMMSKGKITTEELRRQLGEKLPGAVGIMAEAVGVNVNQLDAMLKKGEVLSAEVLPKFAKALEQAYNIENVENIETIAAAQNRLTNAWEIFVKSITEGNTVISRIINGMAIQFTGLAKLFMSEEQKIQYNIIRAQKEFQDNYEAQAEEGYNKLVSQYKNMAYLRNKIYRTQENMLNAKGNGSTNDEKLKLQKQLEEYRFQLAHGNEVILTIQKNQAQKDIAIAQYEYEQKKHIYEKAKDAFESIKWYETQHGEKGVMEKAAKDYAAATGKLEYLRKLTEVDNVTTFKKEDKQGRKPGRKPATFEIKPVNDLSNEIAKSALTAQKELNDELLAGDKASFIERQKAALDNVDVMGSLSDAQYFEDIEKAQTYHDKMLDDLNDAIRDGKKIEGDQVEFRKELEKNFQDATLTAAQNHDKRLLDSKQKYADEQVKIAKWALDKDLDISDDFYNKQIIAAKAEYDVSAKTADDKEKLQIAMTKIAIEMANARIEVQIKELEAQKILYKDFPEKVAEIERMINKLRASVDSYDPSKEVDKQLEKLTEVLEYVSKAADAITGLGDAIFDRRIESINAEIQAESDKYDKLIDLAENNKDEQVRLQAEKDAKLKELEAKRLKEEQRKARFDKANAIAQVGINTALAIMQIWGHSPDPTGISQSTLTAIIATIGAIQAATIIAQPIPKYKDGLINAKSDHIGIINDGGRQEFIERDGNILTTSTKNAIVNLKKGDTVHKSYDDLVGNDMFSNISRSILLNGLSTKSNSSFNEANLEKVFDKHFSGISRNIKEGIHNGFNKVKINNTTKIDMDWIMYKNNTL